MTRFQLILATEEPCVPACNGAIYVITTPSADLLFVILRVNHTSEGWQRKLASQLKLGVREQDRSYLNVPLRENDRRKYGNVTRWARTRTMDEVEAEIRKVMP